MEHTSKGKSFRTALIPKQQRRKAIYDNMHLMDGMTFTTTHSYPQMLPYNGNTDFEFRTTVVKPFHDEASFIDIARMIDGAENYFLQPFTDRDTVLYKGFAAPTGEEMQRYLEIVSPHVKHAAIRGR